MDYINYFLTQEQVNVCYYIVVILFIIGALYIYDCFNKFANNQCDNQKFISYGYDGSNGPSMWKCIFEDAKGSKQSPINLLTISALVVPSNLNPLTFSEEFNQYPCEMKIYNSGLNAILYAKWPGLRRPSITGGPLEGDVYNFVNIRFRWGPTDHEGSEHMVDTNRFAVEMQVAFVKNDEIRCDIVEAARCGDLLIISYLFMATDIDNIMLEPIFEALKNLKQPLTCSMVCPFPFKLVTPPFNANYFFYEGSLTFPPCTEGVKWIIQPEPLLISSKQVKKFRKLSTCNFAPIITNCRPVQMRNEREILYYD